MKSKGMILAAVLMASVLTGCGVAGKDALTESPGTVSGDILSVNAGAVSGSILQPSANEKYQYANDAAVYVDKLYACCEIEQWSLDGTLQKTYTLPGEPNANTYELLYVNNEELFYIDDSSGEEQTETFTGEETGDDIHRIMRVPIRRTGDGQELLMAQREFLLEAGDINIIGRNSMYARAFYANEDYLVWISKGWYDTKEEEYSSFDLHVFDREAGQELELSGGSDGVYAFFSDKIISACTSVCGDSIIFQKWLLEEDAWELSIYSLGEDRAETLDEMGDREGTYITDLDRGTVYYQNGTDQSVWEYDCESGEKREMISEQIFRNCYAREKLDWVESEDDDSHFDADSFFLQGDTLYIMVEQNEASCRLFSYSLERGALQYEKAVTKALQQCRRELEQCRKEIQQAYGIDRHYNTSGVILEGKLLYYTDYEQYYCIDLQTAKTKRVYADDGEKLYFSLVGASVEAEEE